MISQASAPGKIILAGEHAVVYGHPALAVPVFAVRATCRITAGMPGAGPTLHLPDVGDTVCARATPNHPLAALVRATLAQAAASPDPDWTLTATSTTPIAGGLGSGAALATAIVRALLAALGAPAPPETVSALVYATETAYHGTPSGIDNTVIAFERPIHFVRGQPPRPFRVGAPFHLLIADTGIPSPTRAVVDDVRRTRELHPAETDELLEEIAAVARLMQTALEGGSAPRVGALMDANQTLLAALGVSSPEVEALVTAARAAGALGAKLSGGGRGGNVIALVRPESAEPVRAALTQAGAVRVIDTELRNYDSEQQGYRS